MTVDFKLSDFFYPISILKLKAEFDKSQWFSKEEFTTYQTKKLREIILHAYINVPYYNELFSKINLRPEDFKSLSDLKKLPVLSKEDLKNNFIKLQAKNKNKFKPKLMSTSGTSGESLKFLADKPSNILEFVYYWRYWGWAGYRLDDRFAEFSSYYFMKKNKPSDLYYFNRSTNRLLLNSLSISVNNAGLFVDIIRKYKPLFLKGLPSVLYYFALFLKERNINDLNFKAIFTTGEMLLENQRNLIEKIFSCKIYDSYGHMERAIAISECPAGGMHINPEYGVLEPIEIQKQNGVKLAKVIGTSLHNYSMPLLRYEVGDLVELEEEKRCACGREMPLVRRINGRQEDVIIRPDGGIVTTLFIVFNVIPDLEFGQIIQESIDEIVVKITKNDNFTKDKEEILLNYIRKFTGNDMKIYVDYVPKDSLITNNGNKFKKIVSKLDKKLMRI